MSPLIRGGQMGRGLGVPDRQAARRQYDQERRDREHWRAWYKSPRWRMIRRNQLKSEPHCRFHLREHGVLVVATVVDHVNRHNGNWAAFWGGPFQSLCKACHDRHKQRDERLGYSTATGDDGWPTDDRHPANQGSK